MPYRFSRELSEEERKTKQGLQLARGNHKSTSEKSEIATQLLYKDVIHGFSLPFLASCIPDLKGAMVEPCGVCAQFKLQPDGSRQLTDRLIQDLSYAMSSPDASVNKG